MVRSGLGLLAFLSGVNAIVPADEILSLPGWEGPFPSKQYSGYLNVQETKMMHYWFVESQGEASGDPNSDPVVFWFNGGPGCSSLYGKFRELGPMRVDDDDYEKLIYNPYNWAKISNLVFIESPAGVGFSYSTNSSDYTTGDFQTAQDNYDSLEKFFELYPEYKDNEVFITGESYAGIYIPTMAEKVLEAKDTGTSNIDLKGILCGNACIGTNRGVCGTNQSPAPGPEQLRSDYLFRHGLYSVKTRKQVIKGCGVDFENRTSIACQQALAKQGFEVGDTNLYNIYGECIDARNGLMADVAGEIPAAHPQGVYPSEESLTVRRDWERENGNHLIPYYDINGPKACIDSRSMSAYLNRDDVMEAIHVRKPPYTWSICGNQIRYTRQVEDETQELYPYLINRIKVLIVSGDWDASVPHTQDEWWTSEVGERMGTTKSEWHPWYYKGTDGSPQVGGFATVYDSNDFTYTTIKGGRHEFPESACPNFRGSAPAQSLEAFRRFLFQEDF